MKKTLDSIKKAYFLGIGGVSMSSLAMILEGRGKSVSGYDMKKSENTDILEKHGINIDYDYNPNALSGVDTLVFSAAIKPDDKNLISAKEKGIDILTRAELLGIITAGYRHSLGIAGTHGKSTTTGMLSKICLDADSGTAVLAGAVLPFLGGMYKKGNGERVVFEACEYKNSYHAMKPTVKVVLNCEYDHVDFFPTIDDVIESFRKYMDMKREDSPENVAVVNLDCENSVKAAKGTSADVHFFSVEKKTDFFAENIDLSDGYGRFDLVLCDGTKIPSIKLAVPGLHNVSNATAAGAAAYLTGIPKSCIKSGLESFTGVARRFEKLGEYNGAVLVDDYAHHPDEIRATLTAAKNLPYKRIICVFQPHTYTRTKALLADFAAALSLADKAILADIYAAREKNTSGVSSADVANLMQNGSYIPDFESIAAYLADELCDGDLLITMGAGEAYKVAEILLGKR